MGGAIGPDGTHPAFRPKSSIRNTYETNRLLLSFGAINFFRCNTYTAPISVDSKPLTASLRPLDATLTRNRGRGRLWLTRHPADEGERSKWQSPADRG